MSAPFDHQFFRSSCRLHRHTIDWLSVPAESTPSPCSRFRCDDRSVPLPRSRSWAWPARHVPRQFLFASRKNAVRVASDRGSPLLSGPKSDSVGTCQVRASPQLRPTRNRSPCLPFRTAGQGRPCARRSCPAAAASSGRMHWEWPWKQTRSLGVSPCCDCPNASRDNSHKP